MNQEAIWVASNVAVGMINLNAQQVYALLDPSATHFFMAKKLYIS